MQDNYPENKGQFIDDLLGLVDKSIHYRFLEEVHLRKPKKPVLRKKAALTQFQTRLRALRAQENTTNQLTEEELKDIARTFFILLLQKNFFTLTYENWAADVILKELNTTDDCSTLRDFLFPDAKPNLAEQRNPLLPTGNVTYADVRKFVCNGENNKQRFSLWNRQTTFSAFWNNNASANHKLAVTGLAAQKIDRIVPHAERLLFAAKILGFAALLALATTATLLSMGIGSPILVVMVGLCVSSLFACSFSITKSLAKDQTHGNMHNDEKEYHRAFAAPAA